LGAYFAQISYETSTDGIEFMDATVKTLMTALRAIREQADYALKQLEAAEEERSMRWKCKDYRYVKHFTRPVPLEAAGRCPRCKSISLEIVA
jgi:hypothetical protein